MADRTERIVISLGGSLFIPESIDVSFLQSFKSLIEEHVTKGDSFIIIVGGGSIARNYQQAGRQLAKLTKDDTDWIGIYTTRFNAEFMRIVFGEMAYERVIIDPHEAVSTDKPIIFGAGGLPGWSTDYDAVVLARTMGAKRVINLSNTNYVYDKDPKKYPDAVALKSASWTDYRALIPATWEPGLNTPFDPIASRDAQEAGIEVAIINGTRLDEVRKCLQGEEFDGTLLHQ